MLPPENDNEFDDLIKAAGDNYQASGGVPDWEQMHILLDKKMPEKKPRRRIVIFLVPALLLSAVALVYFIWRNNSLKTIPSRQTSFSNIDTTKASVPVVINTTIKDAVVRGNPATSLPPEKTAENRTVLSQKKIADKKPDEGPAATNGLTDHSRKWRKPFLQGNLKQQPQNGTIAGKAGLLFKNSAGRTKAVIRQAGAEDNEPVADPEPIKDSGHPNKNTPAANASIIKTPSKADSEAFNNSPAAIHSVLQIDTAANKMFPATKADVRKANKGNKNNRPLEISLLYAPELTTIGFSYIDKPGSNYGLILGYHILKNFTLQTGIIKSRKNYTSEGKDFTLRRPMPYNYKLNKVEGYCNMLEIPLNIKSQISRGKKYDLFYTAGISSYFMKRESYNYYYSTSGGDSSRYASFDTQNNYWFALATVGLGFEKQLSADFAFSAMPFAKIPFRGMGRGNLQLLSTGINFLLTYHPSFKN